MSKTGVTLTLSGSTKKTAQYLVEDKPADYLFTVKSNQPTFADAGAKRLLQLNRGHWTIENRFHDVREVTFNEDKSQMRTGSGPPQLMAGLQIRESS